MILGHKDMLIIYSIILLQSQSSTNQSRENMEIDLSRVTLRPFSLTDAHDFLRWASDVRVTGNLRWQTFTSEEEALVFIRDVCLPHPWRRSICIDDRSIGFISVFPETGDDRYILFIALEYLFLFTICFDVMVMAYVMLMVQMN